MWVICELIYLCLLKNGYGSHIDGAPLYPLSLPANSGSKHKHTKNCQASAARLIIWLHSRQGKFGQNSHHCVLASGEKGNWPLSSGRDINPRAAAAHCVSYSYIKKRQSNTGVRYRTEKSPAARRHRKDVCFRVRRGLGHFGN
jgi:hypothetical protein